MTQQELHDFMSAKCFAIMMGSRNADLQPSMQRAFGVMLSDDGSNISAFLPKALSNKVLVNLNTNGRAAITVGNPNTHQTLQFKGQYISSHDSTEADMQEVYQNLGGFGEFVGNVFGEEALNYMKNFNIFPMITVTFKVEDIFDQTPRPGTGQKIN